MRFHLQLFWLILLFPFGEVWAGGIFGKVSTKGNQVLPFASITVKEIAAGTTANAQGAYRLQLAEGTYTIICQHVGYGQREQRVVVKGEMVRVDFVLEETSLTLSEIVVRSGAEDPAYEIIRQAIRKRPEHKREIRDFQCDVYIKGQIRLRKFPKTFFGQRVEFETNDTSAHRVLFLSETVARLNYDQPGTQKVEVISTRVSGQTGGFGLADPSMITFYDNQVQFSEALNPRGFVSPIADGALNFYRYKYLGAYFEDGRQINRIEVIPKRSWEPLFRGYIQIIEREWRVHSLQLTLVKQSQMELLDSLTLEQLYMPLSDGRWMLNTQVIYPSAKLFGFDGYGFFTTQFNHYVLNPPLPRKFYDQTILKFDSLSTRRSRLWWDSVRPVPLQPDELADFIVKDSLERRRLEPAYMDSIDRRRNKLTPLGLLVTGQTLSRRRKNLQFGYDPLLKTVSFNTVEGWVVQLSGTLTKTLPGRRELSFTPAVRYGFTNTHLNAFLTTRYRFGSRYLNEFSFSGGKRVFQFNNAGPIPQLLNTSATLFRGLNYMKIYEGWFFNTRYSRGLGNGFNFDVQLNYQRRRPLENRDTLRIWGKPENLENLTPNYPTEITDQNIRPHEAFVTSLSLSYRPGTRYIELPDRKINIGSRFPLFTLVYARGFSGILGSDIEYDRWRFSIRDEINFKLAGELRYHLAVGGFLSSHRVETPDYQHFNGNRRFIVMPYLNSFQLAPYYENSNAENFFSTLHLEYHFNGFLTNKVPLFRRLNLRLVGGVNAFFVNANNNYAEYFLGIENILKILRLDYYIAYNQNGFFDTALRLNIRGFNTIFGDK